MADPFELRTMDFGQRGPNRTDDVDIERQTTGDAQVQSLAAAENSTPLEQSRSHFAEQDVAIQHVVSHIEVGDEVYDRLSLTRKYCITAILSLCGFLAPISSTTVLAATPEVAGSFNTTGTIINLSNAVYFIFMGFSPVFWGPLGQVYGRRWVSRS